VVCEEWTVTESPWLDVMVEKLKCCDAGTFFVKLAGKHSLTQELEIPAYVLYAVKMLERQRENEQ